MTEEYYSVRYCGEEMVVVEDDKDLLSFLKKCPRTYEMTTGRTVLEDVKRYAEDLDLDVNDMEANRASYASAIMRNKIRDFKVVPKKDEDEEDESDYEDYDDDFVEEALDLMEHALNQCDCVEEPGNKVRIVVPGSGTVLYFDRYPGKAHMSQGCPVCDGQLNVIGSYTQRHRMPKLYATVCELCGAQICFGDDEKEYFPLVNEVVDN